MAAFTAKIVAPTENTSGSESKTGHTNADSSGYVRGSSSQTTRKVLSPKRLHEVFDKVFQEFPGAEASLMQDYKDDMYRLKKIDEELVGATEEDAIRLNDEKRLIRQRLYKDDGAGPQRTPTEYMAWAMDVVLDNEAYDYTTRISGYTNMSTDAPEKTSADNPFAGLTGLPDGFYSNNQLGLSVVGTLYNNMTGMGYQAGQSVNQAVGIIQNLTSNLQQGEVIIVGDRKITRTAQGAQVETVRK